MKKIRRPLSLLLALVMLFLLAACGEFVPADDPGKPGDSTGGNDPDSNAPIDDPNAFTVSLRFNNQPYIPRDKYQVVAQWSDGFNVYTAPFNKEDGVARIAGLDGDYKVTLHNLPEGYLYNPNAYVATNDSRKVVIDIYKPVKTSGLGLGRYDSIEISRTGVYRIQIDSPDHQVFFQYAPTGAGTYAVESWMSTAEAQYNPRVDVYTPSIAYKNFMYTINDGGISEGYTQNFKYTVEIAEEMIGPTGQAVFNFAVKCDSKNAIYPVYVDFAITLNGSFELDHLNKVLIIPTEAFSRDGAKNHGGEYEFVWAESTDKFGAENRPIFDGDMFKLWEKEDGGDGYYHVYDEVRYAGGYTEYFDDGTSKTYPAGYGPILYAKISSPHRFTEAPFTNIEDAGNSSLTVNGYQNHKVFISGIQDYLVNQLEFNPQAAGPYFCLADCPCREDDLCIGACGESCTNCAEGCRKLPDEWISQIIRLEPGVTYNTHPETHFMTGDANGNLILIPFALGGYARFCDNNGSYPVTEEIRYFLQSFSVSQRYFADGEGWVEQHPTYKVDAKEADQWLFACGYYLPI